MQAADLDELILIKENLVRGNKKCATRDLLITVSCRTLGTRNEKKQDILLAVYGFVSRPDGLGGCAGHFARA